MTQTFDETAHPRGDDGRFATKPAGEADAELGGDPAREAHHHAGTYADARAAHTAAGKATALGLYAAVTARSEYPDQDAQEPSDVDFDVVVLDDEGALADYLEMESLEPSDADNAASTDPYVDPATGTRTEYHCRILRPGTPLNPPAPRFQMPASQVTDGQLIEVDGVAQRVTDGYNDTEGTLVVTGTSSRRFGKDETVTVVADADFLESRANLTVAEAGVAWTEQEEAMKKVVDRSVTSAALMAKQRYPTARTLHLEHTLGEGTYASVYDADGNDLRDEEEDYGELDEELYESTSLLPMDRPSLLEPYAAGHDPQARDGWGFSGDIEVDKHTGLVGSLKVDIDATIARSFTSR